MSEDPNSSGKRARTEQESSSSRQLFHCCLELAEQKEENAHLRARIDMLEKENAQLRFHLGQQSKGGMDVDAMENAQPHNSNKKQAVSNIIHVGENQLIDSLQFLTRWELDPLPLVSQKFRSVSLPFSTASLHQRRMIDEFAWCPLAPLGDLSYSVGVRLAPKDENDIDEPSEYSQPYYVEDKQRDRVFVHILQRGWKRSKNADSWFVDDFTFNPTREQLLDFIAHSPFLRVRYTTIYGNADGITDHEKWKEVASLWEGSWLRVIPHLHGLGTIEFRWNDYLHNCSNLIIEPGSLGSIAGGLLWSDGEPLGSSSTLCCTKISIHGACRGITFEQVLDYLFASASDGRKRELSAHFLSFPAASLPHNTSKQFKELLEKRLSSVIADSNLSLNFKLLLGFRDSDSLRGTYELLGGGNNSNEGQQPSHQHHRQCTLVAANGVENQVTKITVECC